MSTSPVKDVRKSVQDVAYTAVGVGVLGAQQAAYLSQQAVDRAKAQVAGARTTAERQAGDVTDAAKSTADDAKLRVEDLIHEVSERVEPMMAKVAERVEPLVADVWARVEPVIERIQAKADEVASAGTAEARARLGREPAPSAETRAV